MGGVCLCGVHRAFSIKKNGTEISDRDQKPALDFQPEIGAQVGEPLNHLVKFYPSDPNNSVAADRTKLANAAEKRLTSDQKPISSKELFADISDLRKRRLRESLKGINERSQQLDDINKRRGRIS